MNNTVTSTTFPGQSGFQKPLTLAANEKIAASVALSYSAQAGNGFIRLGAILRYSDDAGATWTQIGAEGVGDAIYIDPDPTATNFNEGSLNMLRESAALAAGDYLVDLRLRVYSGDNNPSIGTFGNAQGQGET